jgi:hypothetical protein
MIWDAGERQARWLTLGILLIVLVASHAFCQTMAGNKWPDAPVQQPTSVSFFDTKVDNDSVVPKTSARHGWEWTYAGVTAGYVASDWYDIHYSELAYKRGYVESNTFLVCGSENACRPSAGALVLRDSVEYLLASAPALLTYAFHNHKLPWYFLAGPGVLIVKHIQGGNVGRRDLP